MTLKVIPYNVAIKSTKTKRNYDIPKAYTNDLNSVEFQFTITDMTEAELSTATANVLLYMRDGSFFQNTEASGVTIDGTAVKYTMKENEGNHSGVSETQVEIFYDDVIDKKLVSQRYQFEILNGLESEVAVEVMIQDWSTLTAELQTAITTANTSLGEFDVALQNGIVAANLAEKLQDFETTNNSRLLTAEQQLAEIETAKKPLSLSRLPRLAFGNYRYNSQSFTQDNITTFNGYQYVVWYDYRKVPFIGKRKLPEGQWETFELGSIVGEPLRYQAIDDGHNVLSMAIDGNGFIHISGNMHNSALRYIRSASPENITTWETLGMTGINEDSVTYPCFVKRADGNLIFLYRNGLSGAGNTYINIYDVLTKTWSKPTPTLIDAFVSNESAYLNHVAVAKDGSIQISGCWRISGAESNNDIFYMKSTDGGLTWKKSTGVSYTLPVTHATAEIILETANTGAGLLNQNGFEVDDNNLPHVAYFRYDANGYSNVFHLYHDGSVWVEKQVTQFTKVNSMLETAGEYMNLSRPSIFTMENRVFIVYRVKYSNKKGSVRMVEVTPSLDQYPDFSILNLDLYDWEPTFDTQALYNRQELHMLVTPATEVNPVVDNWKEQYIGVLSIDLKQINRIIRNEVHIPGLKYLRTINGGELTITNAAAGTANLPYGQFALAEDSEKLLFARLSLRGRSELYTKLTVQVKVVSNLSGTVDTYTFNSVVLDITQSTVNRLTHFAPFDVVGGTGIIVLQRIFEMTPTDSLGNATINGVCLELFELA